MTGEVDLAALGQLEETSSELSVEHARKVAAVLDLPVVPAEGDPIPLLWHWAFFAPDTPTAQLGPDGHPLLPGGGPTEGLPRRMWAGGRVRASAPLRLGAPAQRRSRVLRADRKVGRSGPLLVVTLEHQIVQGGEAVRIEEQDLVYRPAAAAAPAPAPAEPPPQPPAPPAEWSDVVEPGPTLLFRFSALTFNSHRIHYDRRYAIEDEGYPDLVVHGPLTAMLLFHAADRRRSVAASSFEFRATAPLFVGSSVRLTGSGDDEVELQAIRDDGAVSMTAVLR